MGSFALVIFLAGYITSQKKPFKQKIVPLAISGVAAYVLGRFWGEQANPVTLVIDIAGALFMGGWGHIAQNYGSKKIRLKFWKKQNPDNEQT